MSDSVGDLNVKVAEAVLERDVSMFLGMNPKYVIVWKDQKIESEPSYGGGKTPKYEKEEVLSIGTDVGTAGVITLSFFDDNDIICSTEITCQALVDISGAENWFDL